MDYIGAIDQGTSSTRFILFDKQGRIIAQHAMEHEQVMPQPGYVEHDGEELYRNVLECVDKCRAKVDHAYNLVSVGITNQRETTIGVYLYIWALCLRCIIH